MAMTGFECEFAEKVSKGIQAECPICLLVLREPYQAICCGKSFCKECIEPVKADSQPCPTCNRTKKFNLFHNLGLQQSLYDFQVYCTHKNKGCEWSGELRELDNHLNSDPPADTALQGCPFVHIKCPLGCAECVNGVYRKDIKSHFNDKLLSHFMLQNAQRKSFEQQLVEIQDRKSLEQCMTELESKVYELTVENRRLNRELEKIREELKLKPPKTYPSDQPISKQQPATHFLATYKPSGAQFTMTDFEEYKKDGDIWYSPHFYTHPNGYKMCLRVDANGYGASKHKHLSVFICLMRGEFDGQLKWPFRGNITIKLVNQKEDEDHVVKTLAFTEEVPEKFCKRVRIRQRSSDAWGYPDFLPLVELQPKYLKNDCIKLCIKKVELY